MSPRACTSAKEQQHGTTSPLRTSLLVGRAWPSLSKRKKKIWHPPSRISTFDDLLVYKKRRRFLASATEFGFER
ncbi:hypothetical protein GWI33_017929 [Rhynchophorus ferrugineus]|uniref:Uncharacterized protein n=1 Tax=Rhynchophorus ferrugineus TaxID=354439 RepID=A0A834M203_RHYFE|nr:hypothetical protein GWI33_017929 [Rhynchophorus ferrugineus]